MPPPRRSGSEDPALHAAGVAAAARAAAFAGATEQAERRCAQKPPRLVDALSDAELARRLDAAGHLAGAELYLHRFLDAGAHAERALAVGRATGQGQLFPLVYAILGMVWLLQGPSRRGGRAARRRDRGRATDRQRADDRVEPVRRAPTSRSPPATSRPR